MTQTLAEATRIGQLKKLRDMASRLGFWDDVDHYNELLAEAGYKNEDEK